jgi:hypothetical protein
MKMKAFDFPSPPILRQLRTPFFIYFQLPSSLLGGVKSTQAVVLYPIDSTFADGGFTMSPRDVTVSNQSYLSSSETSWHQKMEIAPI